MTMFQEIARKVEDNYQTERETGFLCLGAMRQAITFVAAEEIIAAGRTPDLDALPPWLVAELYEWMDVYAEQGKLMFLFSGVGEVDHSSVAEQLTRLLPPKGSVGPSLDLLTEDLHSPSRKVHEYFTYYLSVPDGVKVRHGLHREYTEAGTLETEFRHGAPIGQRWFDKKGQEIKQGT